MVLAPRDNTEVMLGATIQLVSKEQKRDTKYSSSPFLELACSRRKLQSPETTIQ